MHQRHWRLRQPGMNGALTWFDGIERTSQEQDVERTVRSNRDHKKAEPRQYGARLVAQDEGCKCAGDAASESDNNEPPAAISACTSSSRRFARRWLIMAHGAVGSLRIAA